MSHNWRMRRTTRASSGDDDTLAADLQAIEDSFGVLSDLNVPERVPGDRERHLAEVRST